MGGGADWRAQRRWSVRSRCRAQSKDEDEDERERGLVLFLVVFLFIVLLEYSYLRWFLRFSNSGARRLLPELTAGGGRAAGCPPARLYRPSAFAPCMGHGGSSVIRRGWRPREWMDVAGAAAAATRGFPARAACDLRAAQHKKTRRRPTRRGGVAVLCAPPVSSRMSLQSSVAVKLTVSAGASEGLSALSVSDSTYADPPFPRPPLLL